MANVSKEDKLQALKDAGVDLAASGLSTDSTHKDLDAALDEHDVQVGGGASGSGSGDLDIEVGDPQELRPRDLPLVIKPAKGQEWLNDTQARYAGYLNAYAYRNPAKWAAKKAVLLSRLQEIGKNPEAIQKYESATPGLSFTDKRFQTGNKLGE